MRNAFLDRLCELAREDERVWLLTADLGFSLLERFANRFPDRFLNVGVAEQSLIGVAAGLASTGKVPFVYSIANFPVMRCLEQIRLDLCYNDANVKIVAAGVGLTYGPLGPTHHATEDLAVMRALPNMRIVTPADAAEAATIVAAASAVSGPVYIRLARSGTPAVYDQLPSLRIGESIQLRRGTDATLFASGVVVHEALRAAETLSQDGIHASVIDMHTIKPLDVEAVRRAAKETPAIFAVEEHSLVGGLGTAIAEVLAERAHPAVVFQRIGLPDAFSRDVGSQSWLLEKNGLTASGIHAAVRARLKSAAPAQ